MSYYLFLDDIRKPSEVKWVNLPKSKKWEIVRSFEEFCEAIRIKGMPKFIAFDHDLSMAHCMLNESNQTGIHSAETVSYYPGEEKTGYDCAKWLVEQCEATNSPLPDFDVHSMNSVGARIIRSYLYSYLSSLV